MDPVQSPGPAPESWTQIGAGGSDDKFLLLRGGGGQKESWFQERPLEPGTGRPGPDPMMRADAAHHASPHGGGPAPRRREIKDNSAAKVSARYQ